MGSGHVIRCLSLAGRLAGNGAAITFICRPLPGDLVENIEREGYPVVRLTPSAGAADSKAAVNWLQVPKLQDRTETCEVLEQLRSECLIIDHYGIDAEWERAQRRWVKRIVVIDDLADRPHDCDVLLDQNFFGCQTGNRYAGLVPTHCRLLLGPRYALLQRDYANLRAALVPRRGAPRRVLVFFGASDATDETSKALRALQAPELAHLAVDVVLGVNHPAPEAVAAAAAQRPGTAIFKDLSTLAGLMFRADLAIGAGGVATSERLCMGLPSIVVTLAPNQEGPVSHLADAGAVIWAGRAASVSVAELTTAVSCALRSAADPPPLVDGHGVARAGAAIVPPLPSRLRLRRARIADAGLLFDWRNEPLTREMSFDSSPIVWQTHFEWFQAKLSDRNSDMVIGEVEGLPAGQARLDFRNDEAVLSFSVDPDLRGLGFGRALVERALLFGRSRAARRFIARVKPENAASRNIFQQLGWRETMVDGGLEYRGGQR